ncbi:MAG TPA: DNA polymerase IV [Steroidobacteraceae bacterium]|nr:DNA polymerase IV [Steroidobacteraceae bacterium]
MIRAILHVDMDAFYASVEQRDKPQLTGKPVIVGWPGGRGVVAAASYEVRKFGVRSAMPMGQALRLCPHAICIPPRMQRYREMSGVVFAVFHEITPLVQGLSLDEAFLDVTDSQALLGEPAAIARRIKDTIRSRTGLTASVGAATNKLVAKIASDLEKPDGLTVVPESRIREVLDPLSVRRLPGLGRKLGERVEAAGVRTLGELRMASDATLWPLFGRDTPRMRERAAGIDDRPVRPDLEEKSLSAEDTFAQDLADPRTLDAELCRLAELAGERLRARGLMAGRVGVKIRRHDFATFTRQRAIAPPTQDGRTLRNVARELLSRWLAEHSGAKLRLLGVVLTDLSPASQLGLFDGGRAASSGERPATTAGGTAHVRSARLDCAFDEVRARFGKAALRRGNTIE